MLAPNNTLRRQVKQRYMLEMTHNLSFHEFLCLYNSALTALR